MTPPDCPHAHTVLDTTGRLTFAGGEVSDTLWQRLICLDCGAEIPPAATDANGPELPL